MPAKCTGLLIIPELRAYSRPFFPPSSALRQIVLPLAHLVMAYCFPTQRCVASVEPISFIQLKWTIT